MVDFAILFPLLAVLAGMLFPIQTAINARLSAGVGGPVIATTISFIAGLTALTVIVAVMTRGQPNWAAIRAQPTWLLLAGGLLGATYLSLDVLLVPLIGSGAMMALAIAGQMIAALLIDRNGLFGLVPHAVTSGRLAGAALVVVGAIMVRFL